MCLISALITYELLLDYTFTHPRTEKKKKEKMKERKKDKCWVLIPNIAVTDTDLWGIYSLKKFFEVVNFLIIKIKILNQMKIVCKVPKITRTRHKYTAITNNPRA